MLVDGRGNPIRRAIGFERAWIRETKPGVMDLVSQVTMPPAPADDDGPDEGDLSA